MEEIKDVTIVRLAGERLVLIQGSGDDEVVPSRCVARSQLLRDILSTSNAEEPAKIPVSTCAFLTWLQRVGRACAPADSEPQERPAGWMPTTTAVTSLVPSGPDSPKECMDKLLGLYMAADVLIDQETMSEAAAEVAAVVSTSATAGQFSQVTATLPEHLLLEALSRAPLAYCLLHLPATTPPAALRAHYPSIDSSHSLPLDNIPLAAVQPALAATATLTRLRDLSLAGLTLPREPPATLALLSSLTAITALSLNHTGLSEAAVAAVAAVLPSLPLLATLDLSDNVITAAAMRALEPAFPRCAGLGRVNLLKTIPFSAAGFESVAVATENAAALRRLSALAIGGRGRMQLENGEPEWSRAPIHLAERLGRLPHLRDLALRFKMYIAADAAPAVAGTLAAMTQISRLSYTPPCVTVWEVPDFETMWDDESEEGDAWRALAPVIGTLTQLTALDLRFAAEDEQEARAPRALWLAAIGALTGLRWLAVYNGSGEEASQDAAALAAALPRLRGLTHLDIHDEGLNIRQFDAVPIAAATLPGLRVLRVPFFVTWASDACRDALLAMTHLELALEMQVHDDKSGPLDAAPWLPLVPHATHLSLCASCCDEWLRPLVPVVAAHTALHTFNVFMRTGSLSQRGVLRALLQAAVGLPSIRQQCIYLPGPGRGNPESEAADTDTRDILQLYVNRHATWLDLPSNANPPLPRPPALGDAALTALQHLECGTVADACAVCMPALPQLVLHTLVIGLVAGDDLAALRQLLGHLRHLRKLELGNAQSTAVVDGLRDAVLEIPACDDATCCYLDIREPHPQSGA